MLNWRGLGLIMATAEDMVAATWEAAAAGLGLYGMKMLGGGHFLQDFDAALAFALAQDQVAAYAVGMQSEAEIDMNIALFSGLPVDPLIWQLRAAVRAAWSSRTGVRVVAPVWTIAPAGLFP